MVRPMVFALLLAALMLSACGSADPGRESAKKGYDYYQAQSDVNRCGSPATVRCFIEAAPGAPECSDWQWEIERGRLLDQNADGSIAWIAIDEPGACHVSARGVDKDGKDCTTPRHRILSNPADNAAPIVTRFFNPLGPLPDVRFGRDYHEWRWPGAEGYDPEDSALGKPLDNWHWGVYDGPDDDGDGLGDKLLAFEDAFGRSASFIPDQLFVIPTKDPREFALGIYQNDTGEVDREVHNVVTLTDSQGTSRKWGDGHVTLMK